MMVKLWNLAFVAYVILFLLGLNALAVDEVSLGAGPLRGLVPVSEVIAVAAFDGQEAHLNGPGWVNLRFRIVKALQGTPKVQTVSIPAFTKASAYRVLHGAKRVLLFLKAGTAGTLELTGRQSYIRLEGEDAGLAEEVQEYLDVRRDFSKSEENRRAFRTYMIEKVAASKSTYFRQNMAEELKSMADPLLHGFTEQDIVSISRVAMNENSFSVAEPLCLVLDKLGSDKTDDCILHALLETSVDRTSSRLADVIAKRESVVHGLLQGAENLKDVKDERRLFQVVNHLYQLPDSKVLPGLRTLWLKNPAGRSTIKDYMNRCNSKERSDLLRELEGDDPKKSRP